MRFRCKKSGSLAKSEKPSQFGNLIIFIRKKMTHKGKNYSVKMPKYYFCTRTTWGIEIIILVLSLLVCV